ncbi:hypothetical protein V5740_07520 [Croceibacterium sp. TMG7-5b_MA50]
MVTRTDPVRLTPGKELAVEAPERGPAAEVVEKGRVVAVVR